MEAELRGLMPDALFTGASAARRGQVFASADLFVFPSRTDTAGNVVLEAQACGCRWWRRRVAPARRTWWTAGPVSVRR